MLKASVGAPNGGERILAILGLGSVVGELSIIDGAPRFASVTALRDSKWGGRIRNLAFRMNVIRTRDAEAELQRE